MALKDLGKKDQLRPGAFDKKPREPLFGPRGTPVEDCEELQRVLALPRRPPIDMESMEADLIVVRETARYARVRKPEDGPCQCKKLAPKDECITTLLNVQAVTLREIRMAQGLWASIVTGGGKSMIDLLAMLALSDCKMGLLLVPANLMKQICRQWEILSQHFRVPKIVAHLRGGQTWRCESPTGETQVLHVMSHDGISSPKQSNFIEDIAPDVIIIDEQDAFGDLGSSRTIRLNRFYFEHGEGVKHVGMTGSAVDKEIEEFAHLMIYALKDRAPIPIPTTKVKDWGRCINAVDRPCPAGALTQLIGPEDEDEETETARVRSGFRRRLEDTLGVIMTSSADVQITGGDGSLVSIEVHERTPPSIPARVKEALDMVRGGERPDTMFGNEHNEVFDDPKEQVRCAREVACGMFYRWIFPRKEGRQVIDRWYKVRREYNSEQREEILKGQKWLDSPNLCETAARRYHGELPQDPTRPLWASKSWPEWREVKDTVVPETAVCRIDDYLLQDAAEWAHSNKGIVWYSNRELAAWLAEISGLPVYGGGPDGEDRINSLITSPGEVGSAIIGINSHGRGRDGLQQRYDNQLILNVPSSSKRNQQLYARLHRRGQRSPVVHSHIYIHTDELRSAHMQALRRSDFVEAILKQKQKLKMGMR